MVQNRHQRLITRSKCHSYRNHHVETWRSGYTDTTHTWPHTWRSMLLHPPSSHCTHWRHIVQHEYRKNRPTRRKLRARTIQHKRKTFHTLPRHKDSAWPWSREFYRTRSGFQPISATITSYQTRFLQGTSNNITSKSLHYRKDCITLWRKKIKFNFK